MYSFSMAEDERIIRKGMASYQDGTEAWSGAIYLTDRRLVFIGYMMDISRKYTEDIPLTHIQELKGSKTFGLIGNIVDVSTIRGKRFKFVVEGRDAWLADIRQQMDSTGE